MKFLFFLIPITIFYLIYTIKYSIEFKKNILYSKKVKILHHILFWLIPFVWIILIKAMSANTKGTDYYYRNRGWMEDDTKPNTYDNPDYNGQ